MMRETKLRLQYGMARMLVNSVLDVSFNCREVSELLSTLRNRAGNSLKGRAVFAR